MSDKSISPQRFRGIRKQVSAFLLTALVGFAGLLALIAYKQGMFVQHTHIFFHAPDATGINKGMAVRLYGVPVGAVKDIEFADRGGVRVRLGIASDYIPRLPRGSQARVTREGYVGAASIQIVTAAAGADRTPVVEGEEIRFIAQKGLTDMLDEVRQQMTPAFQELRRAASEMADPNGDFRRSVRSLRALIEQLPDGTREVRQLVRDTDRAMVSLGRQTENTLSIVARVATQTEEQLPVITGKLAVTLDSLNASAVQLREVLQEAPELVRGSGELVRGGGELVRDTQELTAAARRTWLLRDYVDTSSEMRTLPLDSFESFGKK
jgi:phospholipid/cholesterol/gamma-HCH transport system substrate-binding protein